MAKMQMFVKHFPFAIVKCKASTVTISSKC